VTGDFNGDGRTDLVVAVARTSSQIVLLPVQRRWHLWPPNHDFRYRSDGAGNRSYQP
jgi:hypothetical protein